MIRGFSYSSGIILKLKHNMMTDYVFLNLLPTTKEAIELFFAIRTWLESVGLNITKISLDITK
jgi:hypothetical protein